MPACPRPERLLRLLGDDLPEPEQAALVAHLDVCPDCRGKLEVLAARSGLWNDLSLLRDDRLELPTCEWTHEPGPDSGPELPEDDEIPTGLLDPPDEPGTLGKLGPYDVLSLIGRGGMGMVFLARDRALDRLVAIKLLTPGMAATVAARRRFAREAKAAAAVVHDHVVTIHAVDTLPQGIPYLVMQYVAGKSVQELIDRGKSPELAEILRIGSQAASALAAAHAQGLIHRDIKPANILLENGVERVKITDFGLARAVDDATMTQSGVVAGTPQYMSPEQAKGEAIDHRTDLFSLGSVLYALCTGAAPFRGSSSMATLKRVCEQRPRPIRDLNPDIPDWLIKIIDRLHAKDPADRYGSAAEVAALLGHCLAHVQQPASVPLPAELVPVRNRRAIALWGLIPVCLILAGLMSVSSVREAAGQAVNYVATVLRLKTPEGTLVIETDDPGVKINLDGSTLIVTGAGINELRLSVGKHNVQALKDGRILRDELVTIQRGGRTVLSVRREPEPESPPPTALNLPEDARLEYQRQRAKKAAEMQLARTEQASRVEQYWSARLGRPALTPSEGTRVLVPGMGLGGGQPRPLVELQASKDEVRTVCFSPDGRILAYGGKDGRVVLWDWQSHVGAGPSREFHASVSAHPGGVESVAFSPDGKMLVSGGWDHHVKLWNIGANPSSPAPVWDFPGFTDGVRSVAFSPDGTMVAAGGFDKVVIVLDAKSGMRVWTSPTLEQPVNGVAFSPDGRTLGLAMGDYSKGTPGDPVGQPGEVQFWSWPGRNRIGSMGGWTRECKSVAFSPDGDVAAATCGDGTTRLYKVLDRTLIETAVLQTGPFTAGLAFRPDSRLLATSNWSGEVRLWRLDGQAVRASFQAHDQNIPCIAFSPDGQFLATASADHSVKVWDFSEPTVIPSRPSAATTTSEPAQYLAELLKRQPLGPRERSGPGKRLYMRDLAEGRSTIIADPAPLGGPFAEVPDWSHDGRRIVFHVQPRLNDWTESRIILFEGTEGRLTSRDLGAGCCPKFSPDDRTIAFLLLPREVPGAQDGVWLMDPDGSNRRRIAEFGAPFWSPDGSQLLINDLSTPTEPTLYRLATGNAERVRVPGKSIFSWPSWAGPNTLVACVGSRNEPDSIVLLDVSQPSKSRDTSTLWSRSTGPDVYARWPIFSPSTGDYVFIGAEGNRRTLYALSPGGGPRGRLSALDVGSPRLSAPSLSPDGRYLLFVADGLEGESTARAAELPQNGPAREVARLAATLRANPPRPSAKTGERMQLYMRDLAGGATSLIADEPVPGNSWTGSPDWSHDGTRIVFDTSPGKDWIKSRLILMEGQDGKPSYRELGPGNCAKFSPDDQQIAFLLNPGAVPSEQEGVYLMRADGSDRRRIGDFGAPFWSDNGRHLLINSFSDPADCRLYTLATRHLTQILIPGRKIFSWPRWAGTRTLVACVGSGNEPDSIVLLDISQSNEARIVETLWTRSPDQDYYARWPLYSPATGVCYFAGVQGNTRTLLSVKRGGDGRAVAVEGQGHEDELGGLTFSPDRRYLLFGANRPDRAGSATRTIQIDKKAAEEAERLADVLRRHPPRPSLGPGTRMQLYLRDLKGGGVSLIADEPISGLTRTSMPNWSHDGTRIVFHATPDNDWTRSRMIILRAKNGQPAILDIGPGSCPAYSPDDRRIAFLVWPGRNKGERPGTYLMDADGTNRLWVAGLGAPYWSPDGDELLINPFSEPTEAQILDLASGRAATIRLAGHHLMSWPRWVGRNRLVAVICEGEGEQNAALAILDVTNPSEATVREMLWKRGPEQDVLPRWPLYRASADEYYFVGVTPPNNRNLYVLSPDRAARARPLQAEARDDQLEGLTLSPGERYLVFNANRPDRGSLPERADRSAKIDPALEADLLAAALKQHPAQQSDVEDPLRLFLLDRQDGSVTLVADEPDPGSNHVGSPRWSHDGRRILFDSMREIEYEKLRIKAIDRGPEGPRITDLGPGACPAWSPDDNQIAVLLNPGAQPNRNPGIWLTNSDGSNLRPFLDFGIPLWSPSGRVFLIASFSEPRQISVVDFRRQPGTSRGLRLPRWKIHSWPSWAGPETLVAVIGTESTWDGVALVEVNPLGTAKVLETLWARTPALDLKPSWPVYSHSTGSCVFVGEGPGGMALYEVERGKPDGAKRLEDRPLDTRIAGLSLAPGGRYLLFCSTRSIKSGAPPP
jgi:WD40 repeat protein